MTKKQTVVINGYASTLKQFIVEVPEGYTSCDIDAVMVDDRVPFIKMKDGTTFGEPGWYGAKDRLVQVDSNSEFVELTEDDDFAPAYTFIADIVEVDDESDDKGEFYFVDAEGDEIVANYGKVLAGGGDNFFFKHQ